MTLARRGPLASLAGLPSGCSPADYPFVAQTLASNGYSVVIPDYRLYPVVRLPAFVDDGARAVRRTADRVGTDKVFVMGHSAGAHIALMLAANTPVLGTAGVAQNSAARTIPTSRPSPWLAGLLSGRAPTHADVLAWLDAR
jgi:acetyl esterase/lipase